MATTSSIAGQVAIVTGGTAGIGHACAERFAAEGARVAIVGRNREAGDQVLRGLVDGGAEALFVAGECTAAADMQAATAAVVDAWGRVDILVNCAGGFWTVPPIEEIDATEWQEGIDWNINAIFFITQAVVPHMKERSYGRIVNVASVAGRAGFVLASLAYTTGKAAVVGMTRRLALELAPFGITANVVSPGTVRTPRVERYDEDTLARIAAGIPVGRLGKPEELAHGIWSLCTPEAGFTTGAVLDINGGVWTG